MLKIGRDYQAEVKKLMETTAEEELKALLEDVTQAVRVVEEPNQRIREQSSDIYELSDVLKDAVADLEKSLSSRVTKRKF